MADQGSTGNDRDEMMTDMDADRDLAQDSATGDSNDTAGSDMMGNTGMDGGTSGAGGGFPKNQTGGAGDEYSTTGDGHPPRTGGTAGGANDGRGAPPPPGRGG